MSSFNDGYDLVNKLLDMNLPFSDWNGHYKSGRYWTENEFYRPVEEIQKSMMKMLSFMIKDPAIKILTRALETGEAVEYQRLGTTCDFQCPNCDKELEIFCNGKDFIIRGEPCDHPEGVGFAEFEINIPSGKIVVANDLRTWFPVNKDFDINKSIGIYATIMQYAEINLAHGFVGNSCPTVFKDGNSFRIGNWPEDIKDPDPDDKYASIPNPEQCPWGEDVASVTTDLWWYSICDFDDLISRAAHYTPDRNIHDYLEHWSRYVLEVKPGVYRFRHDVESSRGDWGEPTTYATFEWVREPEDMKDLVAADAEMEITVAEALIQSCLDWPTLYLPQSPDSAPLSRKHLSWEECSPEQKERALARVADHIMCANSNGIDWHPNGFPRMEISDEARRLAQDILIRPFEGQHHWYPISPSFSVITRAAKVFSENCHYESEFLKPDFARLALNICQNIIEFGEKPQLNNLVWPPVYDIPYVRNRMRLAAQCYWNIREEYGDVLSDNEAVVSDLNFDDWMMNNREDVEHWINCLDLGPSHPPEDKWPKRPEGWEKTGEYFEFDALKLERGNFCWHPNVMWSAAKKEDAQRYCLLVKSPTEESAEARELGYEYWGGRYGNVDTSIPLWVVGRVIRTAQAGNIGPLIEVAFDYGTESMKSERWALRKDSWPAMRQFNDPEEYEVLKAKAIEYFEAEEAKHPSKMKQLDDLVLD